MAQRFHRAPHVLASAKDGATVLVNLDEGRYYGLNEVGTRIWELIDRNTTLAAIVDVIAQEYEFPSATARDELRRDVTTHVERLRKARLVAVTREV